MIYYAHSKRIYGTEQERAELDWLKKKFPKVLDPNGDLGELGSIVPYLEAVTKCSAVVVSEYQKHIGRGAFSEIEHALSRKKPVHCIRKYRNKFRLVIVSRVEIVDGEDWAVRYGRIVTRQR